MVCRIDPPAELTRAMVTLFHQGEMIGTGLAVTPRIVLSAGHHFNSRVDDVGDFVIKLRSQTTGRIRAKFGQKKVDSDLLVLWVERDVPFYQLRGLLPVVGSRVATIFHSPVAPHDVILSPALVVGNTPSLCKARGTVTSQGSSGGVVVDGAGLSVVGLHLSANSVKRGGGGGRISEFISARAIIEALGDMAIDISTSAASGYGSSPTSVAALLPLNADGRSAEVEEEGE